MIFVTVGSMLPFNRLVRNMDSWAEANPTEEVFAQIGKGAYEPKHMSWARMLPRQEFVKRVLNCSFVVAHAGIGSVFAAAEHRKPIVLLPRFASAKEHTTDHQIHTANWLRGRPGVFIAITDAELSERISEARLASRAGVDFPPWAPAPFLEKIRQVIVKP